MEENILEQQFREDAESLIRFIDNSPSCYHVIDNIKKELRGYKELKENEDWELEPGKGYYVIRNSSSIIAFRIPGTMKSVENGGFLIAAAHSDSPSFKVKQDGEISVDKHYRKLNVEKYGGMIMASWLDRPLSVAGRIFTDEDGRLSERLVNIDRNLFIIPNVAIHMNRDINENCKYSMRSDMQPLMGLTKAEGIICKDSLTGIIAESAGVDADSILSMDLFLYPRVGGTFLGADNELIASRALDDLQCAYSMIQGFIRSGHGSNTESVTGALNNGCGIPVCCVFDNEEVGSGTRQGADSDFLHDVLYRITDVLVNNDVSKKTGDNIEEDVCNNNGCEGKATGIDVNCVLLKLLANSFMISADNAHAVHPNHPEYADESDRPYLNGGVVVKFNAAQKYTTDAYSYARLKRLAKKAGIPLQTYSNRPDIAGGSTLGNISVRHVSIPCVDIGLPQLAMHSCYETGGTYDTGYMIRLLEEYYHQSFLSSSFE